uniref:Uncharacterized protein n=1 Tax=Vibrio phage P018-4 TaxID=3229728 RepID=A0AB39AJV1_9CAUD
MENLMFRTKDGFLYEEGKHFTFVNHKDGGYRLDNLGDTGDYFFSTFKDSSEEEQQLFGRIREILRMVDSFKKKVEL